MMNAKSILTCCLIALSAAGLVSCEKVISVDVNKTEPQMVIEGTLTDQSRVYEVALSRSGNYFEPSLAFPPVTDALVVISDNTGRADTLKETNGGIYRGSKLTGTPGRTYRLSVTAGGKEYTATSTMPARVPITRVLAAPLRLPDGTDAYVLDVVFSDPPELGNHYAVNLNSSKGGNGSLTGEPYILYSDRLTNGNEADMRIRAGRNNLAKGDTLTVELLTIDQATYEYYKTLNDILSVDGGLTTLSPANPTSNLSNNSLGYFGAFTVDTKVITLP